MNDKQRKELFDNIYRTYREDLQRFILSLALRNVTDMDDIFQNTMEAVYKNLDKLRDRDKLKAWLFSIAKTETNRYYSKKKMYLTCEVDELNIDMLAIADAEDFVKDIADVDQFIQLLNGLSDNTQSILLLHYYYELSLVEISKTRRININTVKSIHRRGLAQLEKKLRDGRCYNEG